MLLRRFFFNKVLLSKGLFHVSYNFLKIIHVFLSLTIEDPSPPLPLQKNNNSSISSLNHVGLEPTLILTQILWNILLLVVGIKKEISICILLWKHYWCHTFVCNYALLRKMPYSRQNSYSNKHKGRLTVFKITFITKKCTYIHLPVYDLLAY